VALRRIDVETVAMATPLVHSGYIFLWALFVFGSAVGLVFVERFLAQQGMPPWLIAGIHFISVTIFIFDDILLVGTVAITTIKMLRRQLRE
jgi:hypothetical protein